MGWCSFFTIDPIAQRRFATPVEPGVSVCSLLLRCSVVLPFAPWPPLSAGYTAGEMDVIRKSSIFIAGTSAVPGKS